MPSKQAMSALWNWISKKDQRRKFSLGVGVVVCVLLLSGIHGVAQDKHAPQEVYQAQAIGELTHPGQTFNLTVRINEYSTPQERQTLINAFNKGGSQAVYKALAKMPTKGNIEMTGTIGYDIKYARKIPAGDGFKLVVVTNRPIDVREATNNGISTDYNLSYLEMTLDKETGKGSGTLIPAAMFKVDKKSGEMAVDAYTSSWKLTDIQDRTNR